MTYSEKLKDPRWKQRRAEIIDRDEGLCRRCWPHGLPEDFDDVPEKAVLHVHHKRYIAGREPWDYSGEDLITLCESCHEDVHDLMFVERLRALPSKYGLPRTSGGIAGMEELLSHFIACLKHPNWLGYCEEKQKIRAERAIFWGIRPEDWID